MPDQRYEVFNEKRQSPPVTQRGFYSDFMACNYSDHPIILIDMFNERHVIEPVSHVAPANGYIELVYRSTDAPRADPTQRYSTVEKAIAATRVKLNTFELEFGPIYIEEMGIVICSVDQSQAVNHPRSLLAYENAVREASIAITQNDNSPTLRLYANDPTGLVRELYVYMFSKIVRAPVTCISNRESTITVVITACNQVVYQRSYSMEEFINKNKFIEERKSPIICIGSSRTLVEQYAKRHERETDEIPEDMLKQIKAEAKIEAEAKQQEIIANLTGKLDDSMWEGRTSKQKINDLSFTISEMKNQIEIRDTQINGYKAIFGNREQCEQVSRSKMQTEIVREKTKQALIASDTEQVKHSEIIWKVVGGALIAIGTAMLTSYLKNRKD